MEGSDDSGDGHTFALADHVSSIFRHGGRCVCDGAHWLDVMKNRVGLGKSTSPPRRRKRDRSGARIIKGRPFSSKLRLLWEAVNQS